MTARITKGMIEAAYRELDGIKALSDDPQAYNGKHATLMYHAHSASNYIAVLTKAGKLLPVWITQQPAYFRSIGWNVPR